MATRKGLSLIYELENFANTFLGKGTKFEGDGLFRFGVLSNLLAWGWKPPGMNRVKIRVNWTNFCPFTKFIKITVGLILG